MCSFFEGLRLWWNSPMLVPMVHAHVSTSSGSVYAHTTSLSQIPYNLQRAHSLWALDGWAAPFPMTSHSPQRDRHPKHASWFHELDHHPSEPWKIFPWTWLNPSKLGPYTENHIIGLKTRGCKARGSLDHTTCYESLVSLGGKRMALVEGHGVCGNGQTVNTMCRQRFGKGHWPQWGVGHGWCICTPHGRRRRWSPSTSLTYLDDPVILRIQTVSKSSKSRRTETKKGSPPNSLATSLVSLSAPGIRKSKNYWSKELAGQCMRGRSWSDWLYIEVKFW